MVPTLYGLQYGPRDGVPVAVPYGVSWLGNGIRKVTRSCSVSPCISPQIPDGSWDGILLQDSSDVKLDLVALPLLPGETMDHIKRLV